MMHEHGAFTNQEDIEYMTKKYTKKPIKILLLGYGRHGKDCAAEIFNKHMGLKFTSSSLFCAEKVCFPVLKKEFGYQTVEECFNDRHTTHNGVSNRKRWFDLIKGYNTPDGARLTREILEVADMYVGMRNIEELEACKEQDLFDLIIWIDASGRMIEVEKKFLFFKWKTVTYLPPEGKESMTITKDHADVIIENNGTLEEFEIKIKRLCNTLKKTL